MKLEKRVLIACDLGPRFGSSVAVSLRRDEPCCVHANDESMVDPHHSLNNALLKSRANLVVKLELDNAHLGGARWLQKTPITTRIDETLRALPD